MAVAEASEKMKNRDQAALQMVLSHAFFPPFFLFSWLKTNAGRKATKRRCQIQMFFNEPGLADIN